MSYLNGQESELFARLYAENYPHVMRFIQSRGFPEIDAEDITQETFVRAIVHYQNYDPSIGRIRSWILRIAKNISIDYMRKRHNRPTMLMSELVSDVSDGGSHDPKYSIESYMMVSELLAKLNPKQRTAIQLRALVYRYCEIAGLTGMPIGTVSSVLHRGRELITTFPFYI